MKMKMFAVLTTFLFQESGFEGFEDKDCLFASFLSLCYIQIYSHLWENFQTKSDCVCLLYLPFIDDTAKNLI